MDNEVSGTAPSATGDSKAAKAKEFVSGKVGAASESAKKAMGSASESAKRAYEKAREKAADADIQATVEQVRGYVRENPGKALLISVAAGFLIGLLLRRDGDD